MLLCHAHVPAALITCVIKVKIKRKIGIESNHSELEFLIHDAKIAIKSELPTVKAEKM